jgi:hypothetical protein
VRSSVVRERVKRGVWAISAVSVRPSSVTRNPDGRSSSDLTAAVAEPGSARASAASASALSRTRRAYATGASPITFRRRSSAFAAKARVSSRSVPKSSVSPSTYHLGRSTASAIGATSVSTRVMASA